MLKPNDQVKILKGSLWDHRPEMCYGHVVKDNGDSVEVIVWDEILARERVCDYPKSQLVFEKDTLKHTHH